MEAAIAFNWGYATSTYTGSPLSLERAFHPTWRKECAADPLAEAIKLAGDEADALSATTKKAAADLLRLLSSHPAPEITIDSPEITFEWYKDRHHVAVLSVDEVNVRWAAMVGSENPISGVQVFKDEIPQEALDAIRAAT